MPQTKRCTPGNGQRNPDLFCQRCGLAGRGKHREIGDGRVAVQIEIGARLGTQADLGHPGQLIKDTKPECSGYIIAFDFGIRLIQSQGRLAVNSVLSAKNRPAKSSS